SLASPAAFTRNALFTAVDTLADGSAWAVGFQTAADGTRRTLIEHASGGTWTPVDSPNDGTATTDNSLTAAGGAAGTRGWGGGRAAGGGVGGGGRGGEPQRAAAAGAALRHRPAVAGVGLGDRRRRRARPGRDRHGADRDRRAKRQRRVGGGLLLRWQRRQAAGAALGRQQLEQLADPWRRVAAQGQGRRARQRVGGRHLLQRDHAALPVAVGAFRRDVVDDGDLGRRSHG